jgi:trigger factor
MQSTTKHTGDTQAVLTVSLSADELALVKEHVIKKHAGKTANVPGFRKGHAPVAMIEKQLDPNMLQAEVLEHAVNDYYGEALSETTLRVVNQPKIEVKKFVPFTELEFTAEVEVVGKIALGSYKGVKVARDKVSVTAKDVDEIIKNLRERSSEKTDVARAAKSGDVAVIDFTGVDAKTKEPIAGADGKDYALALGSGTFIPGFEDEVIGLKADDVKNFDITFPADYGTKALQSKKVSFTVTVHTVQEAKLPTLDDAFAKTVGPFETVEELKADIKKQLTAEAEQNAERKYENELIETIVKASTVEMPSVMVEQQLDSLEQEEKQNLLYRGQTWEQHLADEGVTEEQHREKNRAPAELRVKAGLVLSEIAETESIDVTADEIELQLNMLKAQYPDPKMQGELDTVESRRDIASRLLTQKTLDRLKELNK